MVRVRLHGLKIARSRGKYYVYVRTTGAAIVSGFPGTKAELVKHLARPDLIAAYNSPRRRVPIVYPEKTLGWLVAWYRDGDQCPEYAALADSTRGDYDQVLAWLQPEYDFPLADITEAAVYGARDKCAKAKWPAFADKMVTAMSSMFTAAVKRGKMSANPAKGIQRLRKADPNANREWHPWEWPVVLARAPGPLKVAYMLARHVGYRSQSIVAVTWKSYQSDPRFRMCFRMIHRKNGELHWIPASPILQDFLAGLKVRTADGHIALRRNGKAWASPEQLQKQSSNFLTGLARKGLVEPGLTEHGLRATFASEIKRVTGATDEEVAAALGDRDKRMGAHYTRHVEAENLIATAFTRLMVGTGTEQDLENGRVQIFQIEEKPK